MTSDSRLTELGPQRRGRLAGALERRFEQAHGWLAAVAAEGGPEGRFGEPLRIADLSGQLGGGEGGLATKPPTGALRGVCQAEQQIDAAAAHAFGKVRQRIEGSLVVRGGILETGLRHRHPGGLDGIGQRP